MKSASTNNTNRSSRRVVIMVIVDALALLGYFLISRSPALQGWIAGPVSDWLRGRLWWLVELGHDALFGLPNVMLHAGEGLIDLLVICLLASLAACGARRFYADTKQNTREIRAWWHDRRRARG